jgi:hypothetical protein
VNLELKQQLLLTLSCSAMSLSGVVENINFCSVAATACLPAMPRRAAASGTTNPIKVPASWFHYYQRLNPGMN